MFSHLKLVTSIKAVKGDEGDELTSLGVSGVVVNALF